MASAPACHAQAPSSEAPAADATILLTVFLHHDQSKNLAEINQELKKNGYYDQFPAGRSDGRLVVCGDGAPVRS